MGKLRNDILQRLARANKSGYVDWITVSSCLCFSMKYVTDYEALTKRTMYNRVRLEDYGGAEGYLNGLEVAQMDYRQLCEQCRNIPGALFIVDPPYLSTDSSTYNSDGYWQLKDYLNVLSTLAGLQFVYFTADKSQIVELCEWVYSNGGKVGNIFHGTAVHGTQAYLTHRSIYDDLMITNAVKPLLKCN
jgi:site-specific DNA-adenine methylase